MRTKYIISAALMLFLPITATAQTNEQTNEARRQYYSNYSHWSIGLNGGISAMFGDFSTFSNEKFYPAPIASAFVSYQMNPTIGFTLEGYYSYNKLGAVSNNKDEYLNTNGFKADSPTNPLGGPNFLKYNELYSKLSLWQGRLGLDLNLNNIFSGNRDENTRKFTFVFSPSYYLQYYRPVVYRKSDDSRYTSRDLFYQVNNAVGAELALRYRQSRLIDFQLKGGGAYGFNQKFDGIAGDKDSNILTYLQLGVVFKLNGKTQRENILYAVTSEYVPPVDFRNYNTQTQVVHDTVYIERIVERPAAQTSSGEPTSQQGVAQQGTAQTTTRNVFVLPSIGFNRGKANVDRQLYALQLEDIVRAMKENPDIEIDIYGWADHTGSDKRNLQITKQRAENLRNYLISRGIQANRIKNIVGKGKDTLLHGKDALSVKARRAEVKTHTMAN